MSSLLEEIADVAARTRKEQRAFFAAASGSPERSRALRASKALERRLDELLERHARGGGAPSEPPPQGDLFGAAGR